MGSMKGESGGSISFRGDGKFHFAIDRGGTFTDLYCRLPDGTEVVRKLLSEDPMHYIDAPTEGIHRVLDEFSTAQKYPRSLSVIPTFEIGSIRMGTTVATNALLERNGEPMAFITTQGFGDILQIGNQARPDIFDLTCAKPSLLHQRVVQVQERIVLQKFAPPEWKLRYPSAIGITGEPVLIMQTPDLDRLRVELQLLKQAGITALAVALLHSYVYPEHEIMVDNLAKEIGGFTQISLSHQVMPMVKLVSRGHTTSAAAYLTPKIVAYLASFVRGFDDSLLTNVSLTFMKSDGGLSPLQDFGGHQAILSGPAAGVVGYAKALVHQVPVPSDSVTDAQQPQPVIGFDMGGTSTDVSRYDGKHLEHVLETVTAGVAIQAPQLDIHTVAAGGGSRLYWERDKLIVGPQSARAFPGPIAYRNNGYLTVTDANVVLGRCIPKYFPSIFGPNEDLPLDQEQPRKAFQELLEKNFINADPNDKGAKSQWTLEDLAFGFLKVANQAMCRPILNLTQMKGYDIRKHALACFGGAGPQHACAMAQSLGMKKVFVHRYSGILSAYGLALADAAQEAQAPADEILAPDSSLSDHGTRKLQFLQETATQALVRQGHPPESIQVERYLNLRYEGTDTSIMIAENPTSTFAGDFEAAYLREFSFSLQGKRDILVVDYRVRAIVPGPTPRLPESLSVERLGTPPKDDTTRAYFEDGWHDDVPVYIFERLLPGHVIRGPSIIVQPISTIVVELNCEAVVNVCGDLEISVGVEKSKKVEVNGPDLVEQDPVQLSIFAHRFMGIAEQMGRTLQRTAISVNMKERLDFSCALFTGEGGLVANAPHIPVHLGAMERAVRFQYDYWSGAGQEGLKEGDVLVSNHPQLAGGSHLPDITVITPVFYQKKLIFFVASRGHHADIGGISPGSMPPHSVKLEEEGAMIVAFKLVRDGVFQEDGIREILLAPGRFPGNSGTRNLNDNLSDLQAQVAANNAGIKLLQELVNEYGLKHVHAYMGFIQRNAEITVRKMLMDFAKKNGNTAHAVDFMDDGSKIELTIFIDEETGSAKFDFTGTGPQVLGNHNAPPAVTYSAVIYSLRCLVEQDIPLNQGCLAPIEFVIPQYCLLNPSEDAGVVGGNVLTSQRVVDVVLRAFQACAASQGCMNNLTFGNKALGYYETIAGGAGAGPTWDGQSGIHTHCTNTRITDPEVLERRYPVLLREFSIRYGSGGHGEHPGGNGVIRELEPLQPLTMSILSERRTLRPYGLCGGGEGAAGRNLLIRENGIIVNMGGRCSGAMGPGQRLRIETPGGGGYGMSSTKDTCMS